MLDVLLIEYINNPENDYANYNLALEYERIGQTAAAISFFLRTSERTEDKNLAYDCLIKIGQCFDKQGDRNYTVRSMFQSAIALIPERPEGYYFLSRRYEHDRNYFESYVYCQIALGVSITDNKNSLGYPGKWALIFQKAVAAWWCGKGIESRKLLQVLVNEYWNQIDEAHRVAIKNNIKNLGSGPDRHTFRQYDKSKYDKLRFKFKDSEKIERNFAQVYQDMFVLSMLNGKRNCTFLEIGSADPWHGNNTYLLEKDYDWNGISIEFKEEFVKDYKQARPKVNVLNTDALTIDYRKLLQENFSGNVVDYLQLDIEPSENTYKCMLKIPFDDYKFRVITYEHDHYADMSRIYREKSREFLRSKGYLLVANDISPDGVCTFEDWWVHPELIDSEILRIMTDTTDKTKAIEEYMLVPEDRFYESHGCDKYIRENFFSDKSYKGTVVEVGAGPPEFLSMSKHFRDSGWRAICVEPNPKFVSQHKERGHEVYEYACSDDEGYSEFIINLNNVGYSEENNGVSFSSLGIRIDGLPEKDIQHKITVEKIRLNTLLEKINVDKIDLLSVDVEGWELEVLRGFDIAKYRPKVVMLENNIKSDLYEKYMNQHGYSKNAVIGGNEIYVRKNETMQLEPSFKFNVNMNYTSWIIDNFYSDPDKVRKFALSQEYVEGGFGRGFIGRRTEKQFLFDGLKESFENVMGRKITK